MNKEALAKMPLGNIAFKSLAPVNIDGSLKSTTGPSGLSMRRESQFVRRLRECA
jgi:hypothetical protein